MFIAKFINKTFASDFFPVYARAKVLPLLIGFEWLFANGMEKEEKLFSMKVSCMTNGKMFIELKCLRFFFLRFLVNAVSGGPKLNYLLPFAFFFDEVLNVKVPVSNVKGPRWEFCSGTSEFWEFLGLWGEFVVSIF